MVAKYFIIHFFRFQAITPERNFKTTKTYVRNINILFIIYVIRRIVFSE